MTGKRFEFKFNDEEYMYFYIIDNETGKEYKYLIDDELLKLLNDLAEENNHLKRTEKELPKDKNGYNKIICPKCGSDLKYNRFIGYMNGEQYEEFDCTQCDFTGRIRKGNLRDDIK